MKRIQRLLTATLFSLFILPRVLNWGSFLDGLTYGSIARNLAEDEGSFWTPHYSLGTYPVFREHPPLAFYLQSLFIRLFGDSFFIDAVWSAFVALIILALTAAVSRCFARHRKSGVESLMWTAPIGLLTSSTFIWTAQNNMLELTLSAFTLAAVWALLRAQPAFFSGVLGGLFVVLAFLCKGPVGLFPLAAPAVLRFSGVIRNTRQTIITTLGMVLIIACACALFYWMPAAREFFEAYFKNQVSRSLAGERELADSRFFLFQPLLSSLSPSLAILCLMLLFQKSRKLLVKGWQYNREQIIASGFIALSASLPLFLSPKQMSWYIVPSLPFYAIFFEGLFAEICYPFQWTNKVKNSTKKFLTRSLLILSSAGICFMIFGAGKPRRDIEFFNDVLPLQSQLPQKTLFTACRSEQHSDWGLIALLQRHLRASIVRENSDLKILDGQQRETMFKISDAQQPCSEESLKNCQFIAKRATQDTWAALSRSANLNSEVQRRFTVFRCQM